MESRKYTKKVEIWGVVSVPDGFGGYVGQETLIAKKWTNIQTKQSLRNTDNGQLENELTTIFNFRGREFNPKPIENFIIYKGLRYVIDRVENVNLVDVDLKAYCKQYNG